jgi:hypothetical protein
MGGAAARSKYRSGRRNATAIARTTPAVAHLPARDSVSARLVAGATRVSAVTVGRRC